MDIVTASRIQTYPPLNVIDVAAWASSTTKVRSHSRYFGSKGRGHCAASCFLASFFARLGYQRSFGSCCCFGGSYTTAEAIASHSPNATGEICSNLVSSGYLTPHTTKNDGGATDTFDGSGYVGNWVALLR